LPPTREWIVAGAARIFPFQLSDASIPSEVDAVSIVAAAMFKFRMYTLQVFAPECPPGHRALRVGAGEAAASACAGL